ncbi:MAG: LCP family protein, partial [Kineosporiaceae bacterium]
MTVTQTGDAPVRLTRRALRAAGDLRAAPAGLADERALVEALDAVADLTATSHAPAGRPPEVVEAPRTPPAGPRSRREHRLAERRGADRRAGPDESWTGPERRAGQRRAGERRAALVAERSRPGATAAVARPARDAVRRPLVQLVAGVVVIGLLVAAGSWWVVRGRPAPAAPAPVPAAAAPASVTLLVGLTAADGLTSVALLGADGSTAVSLLLPGDVLVDDGAAGLTRLSDPEAASPDAAGDAVADALGVRVDGAWVLTTAGLAGLVDAAGGVRVDVDRATTAGAIQVPAGPGRLTGAQAAVHATSLAAREPVQARLSRFQAVLAAIVAGLPADPDRLAAALRGLGAQSSASLPGDRLATLLVAVRAAAGTGPLAGTVVPLRPVEASAGLAAAQAVDSTAARALVGRLLPDAVV